MAVLALDLQDRLDAVLAREQPLTGDRGRRVRLESSPLQRSASCRT
jgi:hypothetical protein